MAVRTQLAEAVARAQQAMPAPVVRLGRWAYAQVSSASAALRLEPSFIMIGAQRCGTTSLFRALVAHPQAVPPTFRKGINYFDLNYHRGPRWYRGHFALAPRARRRAARHGQPGACEPAAFEASGYYMYHPFAIERMAHDLPAVKLVVMLRDPVERAFSAYKHECARGYEHETFERALALEEERLAGEIDRMRDDITYESFSHRHHSYCHRGHYAEQLERVFGHFPREQVHIIDSEAFFSDPPAEFRRLLAFLGLRPFEPPFGRHNARQGPPMAPAARRMLGEYFAPHDERLAKLLDRRPSWAR